MCEGSLKERCWEKTTAVAERQRVRNWFRKFGIGRNSERARGRGRTSQR
jgi:hypothetical protein